MGDIQSIKFELDPKGVSELCRSSAMQEVLGEAAAELAARANFMSDRREAHVSEFHVPPYASSVDVLDHTAVGVAYTNSKVGAYLENQQKLLASQIH